MKSLSQPIVEGGLRSPHYFNGRLLSGEDLTLEHEAQSEARRQLGRALGAGVVGGLEVRRAETDATGKPIDSRTQPGVVVEAGQAISRDGRIVVLKERTHLSLLRAVRPTASSAAVDPFRPCARLTTGLKPGVEGIYLVTIAPTEAREGVAPVLGTASESTTCKHRVRVEAVEFHLTAIGEPYVLASDLADPNRRRNRVAYKFLGDAARGSWVRDPFGAGARPGPLLEQLPDRLLGPCEVPLALLHWTLVDGITFVDAWSVRRRPSGPPARGEGAWVLGGNSVAEGEARFLQFQDQIRDMSRSSSPGGITASDGFETLPSAGLVPLKSASFPRGFDRSWFPASMTRRRPVHLNGARLQELLRHSFAYPPVRLDSREFFCLYLLRENQPAVGTTPEVQECLVFASGHLPMVAEPRLNLSYWNLSNYL